MYFNGMKIKHYILILMTFMLTSCIFGGTKIRAVSLFKNPYLILSDISNYYKIKYWSRGNESGIYNKNLHLKFKQNSRQCTLNGVKIHLSKAPGKHAGRPVIGKDDFLKLLDPILRKKALPRSIVRTIVLDPGHGGRDTGAIGKIYQEKKLALELAKKLKKKLELIGFKVYLTRTGDTKVGLSDRCKFAKKVKADLFVSIHANAASAQVYGIETFLLTPVGAKATNGGRISRTRATSGNKFDKRNARLAFEIQRCLISNTKTSDRGIRHAGFVVLDEAPCPAVLVETGFLSNRAEEKRLGSSAYQTKIVTGIYNGIRQYASAVGHK